MSERHPRPARVVVVGASAAGLTVAEALRREGFAGELVMVGDETEPPYDRPPLSKQVLKGDWPLRKTHLRNEETLQALEAEWVLGAPADSVDLGRRVVTVGDREIPYDALVIATGVRPRTLPSARQVGVHTLRTLEDATRLRRDLRTTARLAVIGSGFLGIEAAAVARQMDLDVTVIDVLTAPLVRQLGPEIAAHVLDLHLGHGVEFRLGTSVPAIETGSDGRSHIHLDQGDPVVADAVLVGIGSLPNTEWLADSGLTIENGVVCDQHNQAHPHVWAAGDVARWYHPGIGRHLRIEHRMNATEQGMNVAKAIMGNPVPFAPVPYFWTDQYDVKIQAYGHLGGDCEVEVVAGSYTGGRFAAVYRVEGEIVGALSWNMPREVRALRRQLVERMKAATG
ncbi:NAD(P)/FAD-dependent oxidoreductase [Actinomadura rugatobispora]|uniref:NAD(P)/FAD-dependent oxidoreductase n=1 Tax=Actinomadura rugatobispora TaxID=1994 RepID=A0ABW0ZPY5_9ACTN|nr:FAD-dependent oxidoreductase [Actinomadura rugatobispora]